MPDSTLVVFYYGFPVRRIDDSIPLRAFS